jgi:hypothetical protein
MRKTIIFGAIAALLGLAATAQASNDQAERAMRKGGQISHSDSHHRGRTAGHEMHERAEHGERHRDHSREHGKESHERGHRSGAYEDRD